MPYPIACRPTPSLVSPSSLCARREGTDELCAHSDARTGPTAVAQTASDALQ